MAQVLGRSWGQARPTRRATARPHSTRTTSLVELDVDENTPAGENVDSPVTATDLDTTTLTYTLNGPDAGLFSFDTRSAQIRTKAPLNHEDARCAAMTMLRTNPTVMQLHVSYRVTVIVVDRAGGSDATGVNIEVDRQIRGSVGASPSHRSCDGEVEHEPRRDTGTLPITPVPLLPAMKCSTVKAPIVSQPMESTVTGTTATISGTEVHNDHEHVARSQHHLRGASAGEERRARQRLVGTGTGRTNRANHQPIFDDRPGTAFASLTTPSRG